MISEDVHEIPVVIPRTFKVTGSRFKAITLNLQLWTLTTNKDPTPPEKFKTVTSSASNAGGGAGFPRG
jgi:hypothetical protein